MPKGLRGFQKGHRAFSSIKRIILEYTKMRGFVKNCGISIMVVRFVLIAIEKPIHMPMEQKELVQNLYNLVYGY